MHRADAEDAMDAYCDADPLGTGRRMLLRWGKNVKMTVKFGTGGVPTNLRKKARDGEDRKRTIASGQRDGSDRTVDASDGLKPPSLTFYRNEGKPSAATPPSHETLVSTTVDERKVAPPKGPTYDPAKHSTEAITVIAPTDPRRLKFITTVASFVAKDGSVLEQKLIETQSFNLDFRFLTPRDDDAVHPFSSDNDDDDVRFEEHVFYRWRVYSFAQGDGFNSWRTDPFVMFEPHGRFWIPPPLNTLAAQEEEEAEKRRENTILAAQEERRKLSGKKQDCVTTGAQMRRTNADKGGGLKLNEWERKVFHELLREKLCASQESICEAMAFAFDKSGAALEISHLLKVAMLESGAGISVDTRIARLFLLSDILFNSQQPGVKNAFQYRGENTKRQKLRQFDPTQIELLLYRCYRSDVSECV
jgi:U2-associated protein SR140